MTPTPADLEAYLHAHIPLSAAMQVRVVEASPQRVRLAAPLAPNVNHRGTAFGGSAAALAILSGWALAHVRLRARGFGGRLVIRRQAMAYDRPIPETFEAVCETPDEAAWDAMFEALDRHGRGRITLEAILVSGGAEVATFTGVYVALQG